MKRALLVLAIAACGGNGDRPEVKPERQKRVIEPFAGRVRALPPHAIRADGVGPFRLGASLAELLDQLPSGPRIALFEIPGVVHRSLLRAEDDQILIGGEPLGKASFVAVVGGEVARTESGAHVGSTRDELVRALGAPLVQLDRARDPRVVAPSQLRGARVVFDGDRAVALVILAEPAAEPPAHGSASDGASEPACTRPIVSEPSPRRFAACLGSGGGEIIEQDGDDLAIHAPDVDKPVATVHVPGLVFAAALRNPNDDRDELVAVARSDEPTARTWSVLGFRLDGARVIRTLDPAPIYQLTAANARWIGSELRELDLLLELASRPDTLEVGGFLVTRTGDKLRDVVMISQATVPRRRAKSVPADTFDAGTTEPAGSATGDRRSHP